jgi:hypothetical protein
MLVLQMLPGTTTSHSQVGACEIGVFYWESVGDGYTIYCTYWCCLSQYAHITGCIGLQSCTIVLWSLYPCRGHSISYTLFFCVGVDMAIMWPRSDGCGATLIISMVAPLTAIYFCGSTHVESVRCKRVFKNLVIEKRTLLPRQLLDESWLLGR